MLDAVFVVDPLGDCVILIKLPSEDALLLAVVVSIVVSRARDKSLRIEPKIRTVILLLAVEAVVVEVINAVAIVEISVLVDVGAVVRDNTLVEELEAAAEDADALVEELLLRDSSGVVEDCV